MKKKIDILLIEDNEDDALLLVEKIRSGSFAVSYKLIETAKEMEKELEEKNWDIIISDYKLPAFSAPKALKIYKKRDLDIPFIVVSGTIGEDKAVELMKKGAHDFIVKDNTSRLNVAIERELREAKNRAARKNAESQLAKSRQRLGLAIKAAQLGMWDLDLKTEKLTVNEFWLKMLGYGPKEFKPDLGSWKELMHPEDRNRILKELDRLVKGEAEEKVTEYRLKCNSGKYKWVFSLGKVTDKDSQGRPSFIHGIHLDVDDIKRAEIRREEELKDRLEQTIETIGHIVERRDAYTAGHQRRVAELSVAIAGKLGLANGNIETLKYSALIHDLGKIAIPASILNKPGKLSDIEMQMIRMHPAEAAEILKNSSAMREYMEIILQHHERLDGSGYPKGLEDKQIKIEAKIMAVADVFEAMTSHRPYRPALGFKKAIREISNNKSVLYDKKAAKACISLIEEDDFTFKDS